MISVDKSHNGKEKKCISTFIKHNDIKQNHSLIDSDPKIRLQNRSLALDLSNQIDVQVQTTSR